MPVEPVESPGEPEIDLVAGGSGIGPASRFRRYAAFVLDCGIVALASTYPYWPFVLAIVLWWTFAFTFGQSPGKQVMRICAVHPGGARLSWGWMFARELFMSAYWTLTLGIGFFVDAVSILIRDDRRSVVDRFANSTVVRTSDLRQAE